MISDDLIGQISTALAPGRPLEELVRELLVMLELVTDLESTYLTEVDLQGSLQHILYARNSKTLTIPEGLSVPWGDTLCKRALEEGRVYTDDVASCWGDSDAARQLGITTYVSAPVRLDDGQLYGTLCAASSEKKPFTDRSAHVLRLFAQLIAEHIQKQQLLEKLQAANEALRDQSHRDALTGLPNRRAFVEGLGRLFATAKRSANAVYVAFIDLDGFKRINDDHGHEIGDAFLVEIGKRLNAGIRADDLMARLGGDEFIVAGMSRVAIDETTTVAETIKARLAALLVGRFDLPGISVNYHGASIGIAFSDPSRTSPTAAIRDADAAMYIEKRARKQVPGPAFEVATR